MVRRMIATGSAGDRCVISSKLAIRARSIRSIRTATRFRAFRLIPTWPRFRGGRVRADRGAGGPIDRRARGIDRQGCSRGRHVYGGFCRDRRGRPGDARSPRRDRAEWRCAALRPELPRSLRPAHWLHPDLRLLSRGRARTSRTARHGDPIRRLRDAPFGARQAPQDPHRVVDSRRPRRVTPTAISRYG